MSRLFAVMLAVVVVAGVGPAMAHHILGKPAYNASGDASTPPSISLEAQIGRYNITMMAFPIELKPRQPVRIKLYATRMDSDSRFDGQVVFSVRDDSWFSSTEEVLGSQMMDDVGVYTQGMEFTKVGDYIIRARFEADGEPYIIDFPVTVGKPVPLGFLIGAAVLILGSVGGVRVLKRRRRAA